jgi:hypothetical protein
MVRFSIGMFLLVLWVLSALGDIVVLHGTFKGQAFPFFLLGVPAGLLIFFGYRAGRRNQKVG